MITVRDVKCPTCGASAGDRCRAAVGSRSPWISTPHKARSALAARLRARAALRAGRALEWSVSAFLSGLYWISEGEWDLARRRLEVAEQDAEACAAELENATGCSPWGAEFASAAERQYARAAS